MIEAYFDSLEKDYKVYNLWETEFGGTAGSLKLLPDDIVNDNPFFQRPTKNIKGCQIDYLIQNRNNLFVCEIKFSRNVIG